MVQDKNCSNCTNKDTPICNECKVVESAHGRSVPSMYCGYSSAEANEVIIGDLAAMIMSRAKNNIPIHIRYVIRYNKLLEDQINGKKENISASQDT